MNLSLDSGQRQLIAAIRDCDATAPASASGWDVFDRLGLTPALIADREGGHPIGLFEWCLIFEELAALGRDLTELRAARSFLDVFVWERDGHSGAEKHDQARRAGAFAQWAASRPSGASDVTLSVRRSKPSGDDEDQIWQAIVSAPDVDLAAQRTASQKSVDRDLLTCAAYAVGVARRSLEVAHDRASERVLGGRPLLEHQGTAHRLADAAVGLALARVGVWRSAGGRNEPQLGDHQLTAAVADAVTAGIACSRTAVQVFGAAGTSDPVITWLYCTAYGMTAVCGSARSLWESARDRRGRTP